MAAKHSQNPSGLDPLRDPSGGGANHSRHEHEAAAVPTAASRASLRTDLILGVREMGSKGLIPPGLVEALIAPLAYDRTVDSLLLFEGTSFGNGFSREGAHRLCGLSRRLYRLSLYVERSADAPPLVWADNPPPDAVDPLAVVVSQQTAVRALVRNYGWVHVGSDTLVRPRYQPCASAASSEPVPDRGVVVELVESHGSIAEQASAAAAAVA
jgi:hypothetical protein